MDSVRARITITQVYEFEIDPTVYPDATSWQEALEVDRLNAYDFDWDPTEDSVVAELLTDVVNIPWPGDTDGN